MKKEFVYIKFENDNGLMGVMEIEKNTPNEESVLDWLMDNKCKVYKITKEDYIKYSEGDELTLKDLKTKS